MPVADIDSFLKLSSLLFMLNVYHLRSSHVSCFRDVTLSLSSLYDFWEMLTSWTLLTSMVLIFER